MSKLLCEEKTASEMRESGTDAPLSVCFVCTGNTCRSPMAAAVANALAAAEGEVLPTSMRPFALCRIRAFSAGLYAGEGDPISEHAVKALELAGVAVLDGCDYHTHTAHTVTEDDVRRADWLVGMGATHAMELLMRFPAAANKIVCMPTPISDPFGGDLERYRACLAEITEGVKALFFSEASR